MASADFAHFDEYINLLKKQSESGAEITSTLAENIKEFIEQLYREAERDELLTKEIEVLYESRNEMDTAEGKAIYQTKAKFYFKLLSKFKKELEFSKVYREEKMITFADAQKIVDEVKQVKDGVITIDDATYQKDKEFMEKTLNGLVTIVKLDFTEDKEALRFIEQIGDKSIVPELAKLLLISQVNTVEVLKVLNKMGDASIVTAVSEVVLEHDYETVRLAAVETLHLLGDESAIPVLRRVRDEDSSEKVRHNAALVLDDLDPSFLQKIKCWLSSLCK